MAFRKLKDSFVVRVYYHYAYILLEIAHIPPSRAYPPRTIFSRRSVPQYKPVLRVHVHDFLQ